MKTIRQWFEGYPDPEIRAKLLYNLEHHKFKRNSIHYRKRLKYPAFYEALDRGFMWENTPEDSDFWNKLWEKALTCPLGEYPI